MRRLAARLPALSLLLLALLSLSLRGRAEAVESDPLRIGLLAPLFCPFVSGGSAFLKAVTLAERQAERRRRGAARERILAAIDGTLKRRATILLAEHDLNAAFRVQDRYCILSNGALIHEAPRSEAGDEKRLRAVFRRFYRIDRPPAGPKEQE